MLVYYHQKGILEKIGRGIYRSSSLTFNSDWEREDLAWTCSSIEGGIICLLSALDYYGLTDHFPREHWIAIPQKRFTQKRKNTRVVRMRNTDFGVEEIKLAGYKVRIFDRERTVIDAFRYFDKETAITALRNYINPNDDYSPNLKKLHEYAKQLRVNITPYIESIAA